MSRLSQNKIKIKNVGLYQSLYYLPGQNALGMEDREKKDEIKAAESRRNQYKEDLAFRRFYNISTSGAIARTPKKFVPSWGQIGHG